MALTADQLIAELAELVLPEHQFAVAEADDGDGAVAGVLVLAQLGKNGRDAEAAAHQDDSAIQFANVAGQPQRTDEIENEVALAQGGHLDGGFADGLDHHRDGTLAGIEIGHGERDAFTVLVEASHDEMSGTDGARDIGREYVPEKGRRTELFPPSGEKHEPPLT